MKKRLALFLLGIGAMVAVGINAANYSPSYEQEQVAQEQTVPCNPDSVCGPDYCGPNNCYTDTVCNPVPCNPAPCNPAPCNPAPCNPGC
ncbi:MAG: hypothetical protein J1F12_00795 [Muribaculaceae bacterium]|nr:hypothetical protein [Muribaculaceae bacterium]